MDSSFTLANSVTPPGCATNFSSLKTHLRHQELAHIQRAIELSGGDKKKAALLLGVSLATLYRKLEDPPHPEP